MYPHCICMYGKTWYNVKVFVRALEQRSHWLRSDRSTTSFMAGKILSVKRVEPPPSCVRKSTCLCYIFTYEEDGWKERTCLYSTACAECLRQHLASDPGRRRNDTWRLKVTFGRRGACKDNNTVGDAETGESVKKRCFYSFFHDCVNSVCEFEGWLASCQRTGWAVGFLLRMHGLLPFHANCPTLSNHWAFCASLLIVCVVHI